MGIQVRATKLGYYDNKRRREGQVFEIEEKYLVAGKLPKWVEPVDGSFQAKSKPSRSRKVEVDEISSDEVI